MRDAKRDGQMQFLAALSLIGFNTISCNYYCSNKSCLLRHLPLVYVIDYHPPAECSWFPFQTRQSQ